MWNLIRFLLWKVELEFPTHSKRSKCLMLQVLLSFGTMCLSVYVHLWSTDLQRHPSCREEDNKKKKTMLREWIQINKWIKYISLKLSVDKKIEITFVFDLRVSFITLYFMCNELIWYEQYYLGISWNDWIHASENHNFLSRNYIQPINRASANPPSLVGCHPWCPPLLWMWTCNGHCGCNKYWNHSENAITATILLQPMRLNIGQLSPVERFLHYFAPSLLLPAIKIQFCAATVCSQLRISNQLYSRHPYKYTNM